MVGMNSQIHLTLETSELNALRLEAEQLEISVSELIRRKIANLPTPHEIMELRKFKQLINNCK